MSEDLNQIPAPEASEQEKVVKAAPKSSLLPILLIVLAVVIIGGGAYLWWNNSQTEETATNSTASSSSSSSSTSSLTSSAASSSSIAAATAGWSTYTSTAFGLNFKYPSTWTVRSGVGSEDTEGPWVAVTGPTGFLMRMYSTEVGGTCADAGCPTINIVSKKTVVPNSTSTLYLVEVDRAPGRTGVKEIVIGSQDCTVGSINSLFYQMFVTPTWPGTAGSISFSGSYGNDLVENATQQALSASDFFNLPDVKTGELIMQTLSY